MVDYKKLLDAVVGSIARPAPHSPVAQGAEDLGKRIDRTIAEVTSQTPDRLLQKAKDLAIRNPGLTQAALVGLAGLMFRNRKGISGGLVKLGGLAVIGTLAYKAMQARRSGAESPSSTAKLDARGIVDEEIPPQSRFHSVSQTEDDARLFLRTMIAAASADGRIDEAERARIVRGVAEAGIDPQGSSWLEGEMASPADIEELAEPVNDPDLAAQVYAAARITIDPDNLQERDFLSRLSRALDLDPSILREIDETVDGLRQAD